MAKIKLELSNQLKITDPDVKAVIVIGPKHALAALAYDDIRMKFGNRVSPEFFMNAKLIAMTCSSDVIPLYMKNITMIRLPSTCSRHNSPSQSHVLAKFIKNHSTGHNEDIVILCEERNVLASVCAIARSYPLYNRKRSDNTLTTVSIEIMLVNSDGSKGRILSASELSCLSTAAESVRLAARLVDTPCCDMNTDDFVQEIVEVGKSCGITPTIIRGAELEKRGFGGLHSVGKAAEHPPALVILSHIVPNAKETIAWVGKGIVYDTGGLFVKTRNSMVGMKRDCGGAAAVLGAFQLAVKSGFTETLHAIFCLAENAVGPKALRPDDVITLYSGKTVEVNNTDAEGRLVLGDGVAYAKKELKATTILDLATLTGAQGISTGRYHGALVTNSEKWEKLAVAAGRASGDLIHPLIYAPEIHFSEFNSCIADMKNAVADNSNAAASCAGLFIGSHIGFDYDGNWMHVDMAKPSSIGERGTGYGVALLNVLFGHLSKEDLLRKLSPSNQEDGDKKCSS